LRASVGHQINLWDFFEEVGSTPIAFIPQGRMENRPVCRKAPARAGLRQAGRFWGGSAKRLFDAQTVKWLIKDRAAETNLPQGAAMLDSACSIQLAQFAAALALPLACAFAPPGQRIAYAASLPRQSSRLAALRGSLHGVSFSGKLTARCGL
jgi:hypothetical protein